MPGETKQQKAIACANDLILYLTEFQTLRQNAIELVAEYNSENYSSVWFGLPTSAVNADGSLGAQDASPKQTDPINSTSLTKAVTANQLINGVTFLNDFINFLTNVDPGAAQRSQTVDDLAS